MNILLNEDKQLELPKMYKVKQLFSNDKIDDVENCIKLQLNSKEILSIIRPGQKIALAVGSRGIRNIDFIVKTIADELKKLGAEPFVLSAMGSHGNGTSEGQREVLETYGINKEKTGVDIVTNVDVNLIGKTKKGIDVYFDKIALQADLIIPINRVKLHTDFIGELQSGMCKMLVIGLGNQKGCSLIHEDDPANFAKTIEESAEIILDKANVGFGVAILENSYHETAKIEIVLKDNLIEREKELVKISKEYFATLMIPDIDILVLEEIGKNISGPGFDPNVLGRSPILTEYTMNIPKIKRMVLLDLTAESHGSGPGIGMFDIVTKKAVNKLDFEKTYTNVIAAKLIEEAKIPLIVDDEETAIKVAIKATRNLDKNSLKIVKIKNTLELENIQVSEALLNYVKKHEKMILID